MEKLDNNTLKNTYGGAISLGLILAIGAIATLIAGLVDGFIRPYRCR